MSSLSFRREALARQSDADVACADFVVGLVALAFDLPVESVRGADRRRPEAVRARMTAMYLTHVGFNLPLHRVGEAFGLNRGTAANACQRVEDWREDPAFDALAAQLEACVRAAPSRRS